MSREDTVFEPGEVVAERYEIVEELGRGSYGVVYRAVQLGIGRDVALKTLLPETPVDSVEHQRFEREALVISRFNHPNIVTLHDYGEHDDVLFMVMEYIEGRPLREVIDEQAPLAPERIRSITTQILDALQYAHDDNIVHRDLKPANIQLLRNPSIETDETELVKVLDFGIAKIVHGEEDAGALDTLTQTGIAMGTPQYMSPENITGDPVQPHADLYAVGLLIYEMLVGEPAFAGEDPQDVMVAHIKDPPPPLPDRPEVQSFRRAVDWSLRKQPADRIQSARKFRDILEEDAPTPQTPDAAPGAGSESRLIKPLAAVAAASSVVILLLVAMIFFEDAEPEAGPAEADVAVGEPDPVGSGPATDQIDEPDDPDPVDDTEPQPEDGQGEEEVVERAARTVGEAADGIDLGPRDDDAEPDDGDSEPDEDPAETEEPEPSEPEATAQPRPEDSAAEAGGASGPTTDVELTVETDADPARVTIDGEWVGTTPLTEQIPRGDEPLRIEARRDDRGEAVRQLVPDADQTVELELK